ncbi:MAG: ROK family protein [Verrucomicrobiota bacterium]
MKIEPYALGIDLGGSSVKAVVVTARGEVLVKRQEDFDASTSMAWAKRISAIVRGFTAEQGKDPIAIGLSAPGLAAADGKSIVNMPGRLAGLVGLDWTKHLQMEKTVPVLNDGHAALLGEVWMGAGKGCQNVIMLTLGTGVGGAAIVDGQLLRGRLGRAGHLGHTSLDPDGVADICGTPGSLEVAIGNCTIAERSGGRFASTHDLIAGYKSGDAKAKEIWLKSVKALAAGVCSFINILDPEVVIIGGGIARAGDALFKPLEEFLEPMEWQPTGTRAKIVPAQVGEYAGALGAAYHALCFNNKPQKQGKWRIDLVPYVHKAG